MADEEIRRWLDDLGLGEYGEAFAANDVDLALLPQLTTDDLREIGVASVGHRRRILDAIARTPTEATPVAERRVVTVMFCDLMDSTALSVQADPEDYVAFINGFRQELEAAITPFEGAIVNYLGDGLMASFGYPVASGNDAERAVAAGLAVVERVRAMAPFGEHQPRVRVGIATGLTVVGALDASLAVNDRSAIGEIPNLAARLQSVAEPNGVVISPRTRELVGDLFACHDRGSVELKGIDGPVRVWQVIAANQGPTRFEALRGGRATSPFVGRDGDIERIATHVASGGRSVVVVGESGIGKSRLASELVARLPHGRRAVTLQCSPYTVGVELSSLKYMIASRTGIGTVHDPADAERRLLEFLAPRGGASTARLDAVRALLGLPTSDAAEGAVERRVTTFEVLRDVLVADSAGGAPILVEDAQWLDPSSTELMALVEAATTGPIILTMHPGPSPEWLAPATMLRVDLDRLSIAAVGQLVEGLAGDRELPEAVVEAILTRSDGVPIFAEELTRGYLDATTGLAPDAVAETSVPMSLSEAIVGRLDRTANGRRVASVAAAIGREFPVDVLIAVADQPESIVRSAIDELVDIEVLVPAVSPGGRSVRFRHLLVKDAAYDLLLRRERQAIHRRIADTLRTQFPALAEDLPHVMAIQLQGADDPAAASHEWERAGAVAFSRSAYVEAAGHFERALEASTDEGDDERELSVRLQLLSALICGHGYNADDVAEQTERASAVARRMGSSDRLVPALHARWVQIGSVNDVRTAVDIAFRTLDAVRSGSDVDRLVALRMCATSLLFAGRLVEARDHYQQFMDTYDHERHAGAMRTGHSDHAAMVHLGLAEVHLLLGDQSAAERWRRQALDFVAESPRHHDRCQTAVFAGCMHPYLQGRHAEFRGGLDRLRSLIEEWSSPNWTGYYQLFAGLASWHDGDRHGLDVATDGVRGLVQARAFGCWWYLLHADACLDGGSFDEAGRSLAGAATVVARGALEFAPELRRLEARLAAEQHGDLDRAAALLDEARSLAAGSASLLLGQRVDQQARRLEALRSSVGGSS